MPTRTEQRAALTIEIEPELAKRVKAAASARRSSVQDYVETVILDALESDSRTDYIPNQRLTDEERDRGLRAIARIDELRHELFVKHGEKLFPPSWELINEMRDERTRELMRAVKE